MNYENQFNGTKLWREVGTLANCLLQNIFSVQICVDGLLVKYRVGLRTFFFNCLNCFWEVVEAVDVIL